MNPSCSNNAQIGLYDDAFLKKSNNRSWNNATRHPMGDTLEKATGQKRLLDLNELEEIIASTYDNAKIYKDRTKRWHYRKILPRWSGPFEVTQAATHGAITIKSLKDGHEFKVNGQRLKPYMGAHKERDKGVITLGDA
ncbi:hypothetical protein V6N13_023152 [Hibiscus sabdariffa]